MRTIIRHSSLLLLVIALSACVTQEQKESKKHTQKPTQTQQPIHAEQQSQQYKDQQIRISRQKAELQARKKLMTAEADSSHVSAFAAPQRIRSGQLLYEPTLAGETYAELNQNSVKIVTENPVSTFSIDVDTGAYSNVRRILNQGLLPTKDAVRTEELLNYFDYDYAAPATKEVPFQVNYGMLQSPWNKHKHLLQIGIKAWEPKSDVQRADANLVFLIDVSGSMHSADKLPLLKKSLRMLSKQMTSRDKISIVVYAGASGVVLEPTSASNLMAIEGALEQLRAGGSTNGEAGIKLAYNMAHRGFIKEGINRIILATDGDFNVGIANTERLVELIERERENGVALSTLGFGTGNYNDHMMEQLANKGNGSYSYIDSLLEAKKVLVEELDSQLITVAKDVKIQVEFNPDRVSEYRLVGYENRTLAREDFNNDKVDAGEIGAGHTVTAIYEITLAESSDKSIDPLRYQTEAKATTNFSDEIGFVKLRYKQPEGSSSILVSEALTMDAMTKSEQATQDLKFAAAVIAFADKLHGGRYIDDFSYTNIQTLVNVGKGADKHGLRAEFGQLVKLAEVLSES